MLRKLPVAAGPRPPLSRRSEPRLFAANPPAAGRIAAPDTGVAACETAPSPAPSPFDGERPVAAEAPAGVLRYAILGGLAALVLAAPLGIAVWRSAPSAGVPVAVEPLPPASAKPANPLAPATAQRGAEAAAADAKPARANGGAPSTQPSPARSAALPAPSGSPPAPMSTALASPPAEAAAPSGGPPPTTGSTAADLSSPSGSPSTGPAPTPPASSAAAPAPSGLPPHFTGTQSALPASPTAAPAPGGPISQPAAAPPAPPAPKPAVVNRRRTRAETGPHRSARTREMARHHRGQRSAHTAAARERPPGLSPTPQPGQAAAFDRLLNNLTAPGLASAPERPAGQSLSPPAADAPDPFAGRAGDGPPAQ